MKPFSSLALAVGILSAGSLASMADTVYVTSLSSNCTSTTICGNGANADVNSQGQPVYAEGIVGSFTAAIGSAPGKPVEPGARFFSNTFSNSTPDLGITISPTLGIAGGVYQLFHVFNSSAGNVSTDIIMGITNVSGCTLSAASTTKFQRSFGTPVGGQSPWQLLGFVTNSAGISNPVVRIYRVSGTVSAGAQARLVVDTFRFVFYQPCSDIPVVSINGPLATNLTKVSVFNVATNATKVTVYQDSGSGMLSIGSTNLASQVTAVAVNVSGLVKGAMVAATQTITNQEACLPASGQQVGGGSNPSLRIALSIRENVDLTGPAGAAGPGTNLNIYYIGASSVLSGQGPGDALTIYPSNDWQTMTFNRGVDPLNPISPVVLWNNGASGDATLDGNYGVLDGLAIACEGDTGPVEIYLDDMANGTNGVLQGWEGSAVGTSGVEFSPPGNSGTTSGNILALPNDSRVATNTAFSGSKSLAVRFQYNSTATNKWVRLVTAGSTAPNPEIDLNEPVTFKMLLLPPNVSPPAPPALPGSLTISIVNGQVVLNWSGSFPLQKASSVLGPFNDAGVSTGPYTNTSPSSPLFYRLRGN